MYFTFLLLFFLCSCSASYKNQSDSDVKKTERLRICPDAWYSNQMPGIDSDSPQTLREYMIVQGQRRELEEMDMEWIRLNCEIKEPERIY